MSVTVPLGPAQVDLVGVRAGDQNLIGMSLSSNGVPLDLTDRTVTAQARLTALSADAMDAVVEIGDAAAGTFTLRWPGDAVTDMLAGKTSVKGVWDLQVAAAGSDPVTVVAGKITLEMDVTRP